MTAPAPLHPSSYGAPALRVALPPYAVPAAQAAPMGGVPRVGPFVPEAWRSAMASERIEAVAATAGAVETVHELDPEVVHVAAPTPGVVMAIPARIPPYRPLRPTPMAAPATRPSLYIPPASTPASTPASKSAAIAENGFVEPALGPVFASEATVSGAATSPTAPSETPTSETAVQELPWIEAFLASTPPLPMTSIAPPAESLPGTDSLLDHHAVRAELTDVTGPAAVTAGSDDADGIASAADEWPLAEAAAEFGALRARLEAETVGGSAPARADIPALSPWSDDDLMDIMPVRQAGRTPLGTPRSNVATSAAGDLWADRARKAQEEAQVFRAMAAAKSDEPDLREARPASDSTAEEAAHSLEVLARRVRAGELMLPSYDPRMGEPAALVAALAALLGVRLR